MKNKVSEIVSEFSTWDLDEQPLETFVAFFQKVILENEKLGFSNFRTVLNQPYETDFNNVKIWADRDETPREERERLKQADTTIPVEIKKGWGARIKARFFRKRNAEEIKKND